MRTEKKQTRWETNLIFIAVCHAVALNEKETEALRKDIFSKIYDRGIKIRKYKFFFHGKDRKPFIFYTCHFLLAPLNIYFLARNYIKYSI